MKVHSMNGERRKNITLESVQLKKKFKYYKYLVNINTFLALKIKIWCIIKNMNLNAL